MSFNKGIAFFIRNFNHDYKKLFGFTDVSATCRM